MRTACVLAIGDELLEGRVDTNGAWLGQTLDAAGWSLIEVRHCRDDVAAIVRNLQELTTLVPLVITTGGLGPTTDDLTTEAVVKWSGRPLEVHQETWEFIQARFRERGYALPPDNIKQAQYPAGAIVIPNPMGTALGYIVSVGQSYVAVFPGVPREMKAMVETSLLPWLARIFPSGEMRAVRRLRIFGMTESGVNEALRGIAKGMAGISIGYLVSYPEVLLTFKVVRPTREEAERVAGELVVAARQRLGDKIYGEGDETLEAVVGRLLASQRLRIALAESCTGGLIAKRLTDIPGSSAYVSEGVVCYSNGAKVRYLSVKRETLRQHGAVSAETCEEMLTGMLERSGADIAVAVTGIAGPGGGTPDKPIGLVFIGWGGADGYEVREFRFHGTREDIRQLAATTALDRVRRLLLARATA